MFKSSNFIIALLFIIQACIGSTEVEKALKSGEYSKITTYFDAADMQGRKAILALMRSEQRRLQSAIVGYSPLPQKDKGPALNIRKLSDCILQLGTPKANKK